ncbi:MAG: hypothetical protein PVF87_12545 [Acidimicrobiia bacterium]
MAEVQLGPYHLAIAEDFGPRIISVRRGRGPEALATLGPETAIEYPGGVFRFRGGHRLWAAPETPAITYASDEHRCSVAFDGAGVRVTAPADDAGLVKELRVRDDGGSLVVEHVITGEVTGNMIAAWGITQLPLGGVAILPLTGGETGPRANRQLVMWPYTTLADGRLQHGDSTIRIEARDEEPLKLGIGPTVGRLGYLKDGQLFIKELADSSPGPVPDFGAGGQVYIGQGFCELETVGGLVDLRHGAATSTERWTLLSCGDTSEAERLILEGTH